MVVFPLHSVRWITPVLLRKVVVGTWCSAVILLFLQYLPLIVKVPKAQDYRCSINSSFYVLCLCIMIVIYAKLCHTARKQQRSIAQLTVPVNGHVTTANRKPSRSTVIVLLVLGVYIITWLPSIILCHVNAKTDFEKYYNETSHLAYWLGLCNSGANFAIYSLLSKDFRKTLNELLIKLRKPRN